MLNPRERFRVEPSCAEEGYKEYFIIDLDLSLKTGIRKAWLEEPTFDLVSMGCMFKPKLRRALATENRDAALPVMR